MQRCVGVKNRVTTPEQREKDTEPPDTVMSTGKSTHQAPGNHPPSKAPVSTSQPATQPTTQPHAQPGNTANINYDAPTGADNIHPDETDSAGPSDPSHASDPSDPPVNNGRTDSDKVADTAPTNCCIFIHCGLPVIAAGAPLCSVHLALAAAGPPRRNSQSRANAGNLDSGRGKARPDNAFNGSANRKTSGSYLDNGISNTAATNSNLPTRQPATVSASSNALRDYSKSPYLRRKTASSGRMPSFSAVSAAGARASQSPAAAEAALRSQNGSVSMGWRQNEWPGGPSINPTTEGHPGSLSRKRSRADFQEDGHLNDFSFQPRIVSEAEEDGSAAPPISQNSPSRSGAMSSGVPPLTGKDDNNAGETAANDSRHGTVLNNGVPNQESTHSTRTLNPGVKDWWHADRSKRFRRGTTEEAVPLHPAANTAKPVIDSASWSIGQAASIAQTPGASQAEAEAGAQVGTMRGKPLQSGRESGVDEDTATQLPVVSPTASLNAIRLSEILNEEAHNRRRDYDRLSEQRLGGRAYRQAQSGPGLSLEAHIYSQEGAAPPPQGVTVPSKTEVILSALAGGCAPSLSATSPPLSSPPLLSTSSSSFSSHRYVSLDPRIHWTRRRSPDWLAAKQREIKKRGGRKANFGKAAERQAQHRRQEQYQPENGSSSHGHGTGGGSSSRSSSRNVAGIETASSSPGALPLDEDEPLEVQSDRGWMSFMKTFSRLDDGQYQRK